jgi:hypothetical protein
LTFQPVSCPLDWGRGEAAAGSGHSRGTADLLVHIAVTVSERKGWQMKAREEVEPARKASASSYILQKEMKRGAGPMQSGSR